MPDNQLSYNWQRYLCPANVPYERTEDGYLIPPDAGQYWRRNEHLQTLDSLAYEPCVIILGESGIGKSTAMSQAAACLRQQLGPEDYIVEESFAKYSARGELTSELFGNEKFNAWRTGMGSLSLFFDGLDEAHEKIDVLLAGLIANLDRLPRKRLYLCIASRPAAWPVDKEAELCSLWGLSDLPKYKVTVLSRQDVYLAAQSNRVPPEIFLQELIECEITPLAAIPITLDMLIRQHQLTGSLPTTRSELYSKACIELCTEPNPRHRRASRYDITTAPQRLIIAARLAALSLFSGNNLIVSEPVSEPLSSTEAQIHEFTGFVESINGEDINVGERAILETLDTGLFMVQNDRFAWMHRSLQEYLAAYYLHQHALHLIQLTSLFEAPSDIMDPGI